LQIVYYDGIMIAQKQVHLIQTVPELISNLAEISRTSILIRRVDSKEELTGAVIKATRKLSREEREEHIERLEHLLRLGLHHDIYAWSH